MKAQALSTLVFEFPFVPWVFCRYVGVTNWIYVYQDEL